MTNTLFRPIEEESNQYTSSENSLFRPIEDEEQQQDPVYNKELGEVFSKPFKENLQSIKDFVYNPEESIGKNIGRTIAQVPKVGAYYLAGIPNVVLEGAKALGTATAGKDIPEEIRELQAEYPEQAEEIEKNFIKSAQEAGAIGEKYFPSLSSLENAAEQSGVPLKDKTGLQTTTELATIGNIGAKAGQYSKAALAPAIYWLIENENIPEWVSKTLATFFSHTFKAGKNIKGLPEPNAPNYNGPAQNPPPPPTTPKVNPNAPSKVIESRPKLTAPQAEKQNNKNLITPEQAYNQLTNKKISNRPSQVVKEGAQKALYNPESPQDYTEIPYYNAKPQKAEEKQLVLPEPIPPKLKQVKYVEPDVEFERNLQKVKHPEQLEERMNKHIGNKISPVELPSTTEAGEHVMNKLAETEQHVRKEEERLYGLADHAYKNINQHIPSLIKYAAETVHKLEKVPENLLSPQKKFLLNQSRSILEYATVMDPNGARNYKDVNGSVLIELRKDLNKHLDYEFMHAKKGNEFYPYKKAIDKSLEEMAKSSGDKNAKVLLDIANHFHRKQWTDRFENALILPYRKRGEIRPSSAKFKGMTRPDTVRAIEDALTCFGESNSADTIGMTKKYAVTEILNPYMKNPDRIGSLDYQKDLKELSSIITPKQLSGIQDVFKFYKRMHDKSKKLTELQKNASEREKEKLAEHERKYKAAVRQQNAKNALIKQKAKIEYDVIADKAVEEHKAAFKAEKLRVEEANEKHELQKKKDMQMWADKYAPVEALKNLSAKEFIDKGKTLEGLRHVLFYLNKTKQGREFAEKVYKPVVAHEVVYGSKQHGEPIDFLKATLDKEKRAVLFELIGGRDLALIRKHAIKAQDMKNLMMKKQINEDAIREMEANGILKKYSDNPIEMAEHLVDVLTGKWVSTAKKGKRLLTEYATNSKRSEELLAEESALKKAIESGRVVKPK